MATEEQILDDLSNSISTWNNRLMIRSVNDAVEANIPLERIVTDGLGKGMEKIGQMFDDAKIYLSQVVAAAKIMESALNILNVGDNIPDEMYRGVIVMGSVQGDIHEIGKDVCVAMLRGAGYKVVDLGPDVSPERFVEAVKRYNADVLGGSALMTTTLAMQQRIVKEVHENGVNVYMLFGGAPCTREWVEEIGGDGYSRHAPEMTDLVNRLLGKN